jgi:heat-inducible transcriptional repressor
MEGASNLVIFDFQTTRENLKEMLRALEEKKRILELLDRFLEQRGGKVRVKIGLAEQHPSLGELSLIGVTVRMPGGMDAKIAVVGPMRMDYERVVSAVLHVGRAFSGIPS